MNVPKLATFSAVSGVVGEAVARAKGFSAVRTKMGELPFWATFAVIGGSASVMTDALHSVILERISKDEKMKNLESALMNPTVAGAMMYAGFELLVPGFIRPENLNTLEVFALGAGAELASQTLYEKYVSPIASPASTLFGA